MATLYKTDGTEEEVTAANGRDFSLEELYKLIGCEWIQVIDISNTELLIFDEEAKPPHNNKPRNEKATARFLEFRRLPGDYIAGDAVLCKRSEFT